jgi:hypothetical protein
MWSGCVRCSKKASVDRVVGLAVRTAETQLVGLADFLTSYESEGK